MKDYEYYINKIKKDLNLTDEKIKNSKSISNLIYNIIDWCKKDLKKYSSDTKINQLVIATNKLQNELFIKKYC